MKKLLIILIIFLFIGCVSATENQNQTNAFTKINNDTNIEIENDTDKINFNDNLTLPEKNSQDLTIKNKTELPLIYSSHIKEQKINTGLINIYKNNEKILNLIPENKTIHIIKIENTTYEESTSILIKFDNITNSLNEIGIIISNESGIVFKDEWLVIDENGTCEINFEHYFYDYENNLIINLNVGQYNVIIINYKDMTNDTSSFKILKSNIDIFEDEISYYLFSLTFCIEANYFIPNNINIKVILENETDKFMKKTTSKKEHEAEITFYNLHPGEYNASLYYYINENYNPLNYTKTVKVYKENVNIEEYHETTEDKIDLYITTNILYSENILTIKFENQIKKIPIKDYTKDLKVTFENLNPGQYEVLIELPEDDKYLSSSLSVPFEILGKIKDTNITNSTEPINETQNLTQFNNNISNTSSNGNNNRNSSANIKNIHPKFKTQNNKKENKKIENNIGVSSQKNQLSNTNTYEISKKTTSKSINNNPLLFLIISSIILISIFMGYIKFKKEEIDEY